MGSLAALPSAFLRPLIGRSLPSRGLWLSEYDRPPLQPPSLALGWRRQGSSGINWPPLVAITCMARFVTCILQSITDVDAPDRHPRSTYSFEWPSLHHRQCLSATFVWCIELSLAAAFSTTVNGKLGAQRTAFWLVVV
ncbi:hypothetical protein V2G26_006018 [Clonostachys chloroleuca]